MFAVHKVEWSSLELWGPIFEKSYDELTKNLWKSLTYEKLRMTMCYQNILQKSYEKLKTKLCKTYENLGRHYRYLTKM